MIFILLGLVLIGICLKTGSWRNWKEYYSTGLYVIMGNLIYDLIACDKPFWDFGFIVKDYFLLELLLIVCLYPSTTILFLTYFPKQMYKKIVYILLWAGLYIVVELASLKWCGFTYYNGWNLLYTIGFDIIMFMLIRLHYKKPILTWVASLIIALIFIWWFDIPLKSMPTS